MKALQEHLRIPRVPAGMAAMTPVLSECPIFYPKVKIFTHPIPLIEPLTGMERDKCENEAGWE